jgi:hypothetical protein
MRMSKKAVLLASSALLALAAPALADSYFFRVKPLVDPPVAFSFTAASNVVPGSVVESSPIRLNGFRGTTASVSGGEYQICATSTCSDQASWKTVPTPDLAVESYARVRVTAGAFGQVASATLTVGGTSAAFEAASRAKDTQPAGFSFASKANAEVNEASFSAPVTLADFDGAPLSVSGGGYQICTTADCSDRNGQPVLSAAMTEVTAGTRVRLVATPATFGAPTVVTLNVGGITGSYTATARARDTVPDTVTFASLVDQTEATSVTSATAQLVNHDGVTATVSGSTAEMRVCSAANCSGGTVGAWGTSFAVAKNEYVQLRMTSDAANVTRTASLAYGATQPATWDVTSKASGVYAFTSHLFTSCGVKGRNGPSLAQCRSAYTTTWDDNGANFSVGNGGYQAWTVPATGTYSITAAGARGGVGWSNAPSGNGRKVTAQFSLTAGETILIAVGQPGTDASHSQAGGGGGGGTFVARGASFASATPLLVAAGGGGTNAVMYGRNTNGDSLGIDGRLSNTGDVSRSTNGGTYLGNGASFTKNGTSTTYSGSYNAGSFRDGLGGGTSGPYGNPGGFGGGGGPYWHNGGGGGGYTGGSGGMNNTYVGEGGGSFVAASAISQSDGGSNGGDGSVTITKQ